MKEKNQVESNSKVFEYLGVISFIATTFMCAFGYWIYRILFVGDYVEGFIIAPYLFLAPLLQMLFQVACNQFLVIKKTWPNLFILMSGAVLNIVLNFVLIPVLGIEGAAIATLIGYVVTDIIVVIVLCRMRLMVLSKKFIVLTVGMCLFFLIWRLWTVRNLLLSLMMAILYLLGGFILYKKEVIVLFDRLKLIVKRI